MFKSLILSVTVTVSLGAAAALAADPQNIYITEFCSDTGDNQHFEFVEFTNVGYTPVSMAGWSEDDSNAKPNQIDHSLTGLGILQPGESGIITEATPTNFRNYWGPNMPSSVPVVGPYTNDNLSTTSDSITLFNASGVLVDRLDYDANNGGTADMVTRNCPPSALGNNRNEVWANSYNNDAYGSFPAAQKTSIIGNPGTYSIPEPASAGLIGVVAVLGMMRRRPRMRG
jgi:hypothetical protein